MLGVMHCRDGTHGDFGSGVMPPSPDAGNPFGLGLDVFAADIASLVLTKAGIPIGGLFERRRAVTDSPAALSLEFQQPQNGELGDSAHSMSPIQSEPCGGFSATLLRDCCEDYHTTGTGLECCCARRESQMRASREGHYSPPGVTRNGASAAPDDDGCGQQLMLSSPTYSDPSAYEDVPRYDTMYGQTQLEPPTVTGPMGLGPTNTPPLAHQWDAVHHHRAGPSQYLDSNSEYIMQSANGQVYGNSAPYMKGPVVSDADYPAYGQSHHVTAYHDDSESKYIPDSRDHDWNSGANGLVHVSSVAGQNFQYATASASPLNPGIRVPIMPNSQYANSPHTAFSSASGFSNAYYTAGLQADFFASPHATPQFTPYHETPRTTTYPAPPSLPTVTIPDQIALPSPVRQLEYHRLPSPHQIRKRSLAEIAPAPSSPDRKQRRRTSSQAHVYYEHDVAYDSKQEGEGQITLIPKGSAGSGSPDGQHQGAHGKALKKTQSRRAYDAKEKQEIAQARKDGVCVRCKMYKEKCQGFSGAGPCQRCSSLKSGPWKEICVSANICAAQSAVYERKLYQRRFDVLKNNVDVWEPASMRCITVSNGYSPSLTLNVSRFVPKEKALLKHIFWRETRDAIFTIMPSSPYALPDGVEVSDAELDSYLLQNVQPLLDEYTRNHQSSRPAYTVMLKIANDVMKSHCENYDLLQLAFQLWAAQHIFFHRVWRMEGSDKCDMDPIHAPGSYYHRVTPLPRHLNQQLDSIVEKRMEGLERDFLQKLQALALSGNGKKDTKQQSKTFIIYLCIFVYLSGLERDTWGLYAWQMELERQSEKIPRPNDDCVPFTWPLDDHPGHFIKKNITVAMNLANYCKCLYKGGIPFVDKSAAAGHHKTQNSKNAIQAGPSESVHLEKAVEAVLNKPGEQQRLKSYGTIVGETKNFSKNVDHCLDLTFSYSILVGP